MAAKIMSLWVLLAVAAHKNFVVHQLNVNFAYLNRVIDSDIFMSQLPVYVDAKHPNLVCQLLKGLYGIKQGGCLWHAIIYRFLLKIGFIQSMADPCIYVCRSATGIF